MRPVWRSFHGAVSAGPTARLPRNRSSHQQHVNSSESATPHPRPQGAAGDVRPQGPAMDVRPQGAMDGARLNPGVALQLLEQVRAAGDEHQPAAQLGQLPREVDAQARGGARDERGLAGE